MEWSIFWTVLGQVSIVIFALAILSVPLRYVLSNIVYGVVQALPKKQDSSHIFYGGSSDDD
jgi:hypothetical protein